MEKRPNILLITADQYRYDWLGCAGFPVSTPNLDRIAEKGVRFTQASCTSPVCTPSRICLATGKYPHNTGINYHDASMALDEVTYYQLLRKSGYRVGLVGKSDLHKRLHYFGENGNTPVMYHFGFTDVFETEAKANAVKPGRRDGKPLHADGAEGQLFTPVGPYQKLLIEKNELEPLAESYRAFWGKPTYKHADISVLPEEDYLDCFVGRNACKMLREFPKHEPWHLFVSFLGPHPPYDAPKSYYEKYEHTTFPDSIKDDLSGKPAWVKQKSVRNCDGMQDEELQYVKRFYAAAITVIDDWIGELLKTLEERGEADNTVIVFSSDHGDMMGDHNLMEKNVMYEGALRVPLIISAPWMKEGTTSDALAELFDLAPTFLDMAGADYNRKDMDATSLLPLLKGETDTHKPVQISELHNTRMVYDGRYKWIANTNDFSELYDLQEDPSELHNLAAERPDVIKRLQSYSYSH